MEIDVRHSFVMMLCVVAGCVGVAQAQTKTPIHYGSNAAAGHTFVHDGVTLYYETYGAGQPLLLVHGNGGSIGNFAAQIQYFSTHYLVIAMDSREQGKSGSSSAPLKYEVMTDDVAALLDHLHTPPVDVLGWSDGGIEALLLGIRHPEKVRMIASMAANLYPEGAHPDVIALAHMMIDSMPKGDQQTPADKRELKVSELLLTEPHIKMEALQAIKAPTLILASDHDVILDQHTLDMYHHIPNAELCIFPNATHMVPFDDPEHFDAVVDHFFQTPYKPKDRIKDLMTSFEKMQAGPK